MAITRIGPNQSINLASNITGTLPVANGGTAITSGFINGTATPGKVLQVVSASSSTETSTSDGNWLDYTSASITPSSSSNKILVIGSVNSFRRDNTSGIVAARVTDKSSFNKKLVHAALYDGNANNKRQGGVTGTFLHSASTTSAKTYYLQFATNNSSQAVTIGDNNDSNSTITLMEIAG